MAGKNDWLRGVGMGLMGYARHTTEQRRIDIEKQRADTLERIQSGQLELGRENLEINRQDLAIKQAQEDRRLGQTDARIGNETTLAEATVRQGDRRLDISETQGLMSDATANRGISVREALGQEGNRLTGVGLELRGELGRDQNAIAREGLTMREEMLGRQIGVAEEGNRIREELGKAADATTRRGQDIQDTANSERAAVQREQLAAQVEQWGTLNSAALGRDQGDFVADLQTRIDSMLDPGDMDQIEYTKQVDAILKNAGGGVDGLSPEEVQTAMETLDGIYMDRRLAALEKGTPEYASAKREARKYMDDIVNVMKSGRKRATSRFGDEFGDALSGYLSLGSDASFLQDSLMPVTPAPRLPGAPTGIHPRRGTDAFMPGNDPSVDALEKGLMWGGQRRR